MNAYAVIVLVALLSEYLLSITASLLNLRAMSPEVPTEFLGVYEIDRYAKSQEYTHARTRFGLVQESVRLAVLLAFWQLGGFGWLDRAVRAQGWGEIGSGLLFVGGLMAASGLIGLPFQLYSTFFIEERFGFNRTTMATFWSDRVKAVMMSVVIGGLLLSATVSEWGVRLDSVSTDSFFNAETKGSQLPVVWTANSSASNSFCRDRA